FLYDTSQYLIGVTSGGAYGITWQQYTISATLDLTAALMDAGAPGAGLAAQLAGRTTLIVAASNPATTINAVGHAIDGLVQRAKSGKGSSGTGGSSSTGGTLRPEAGYTGCKKHGVNWKEGPATAKALGKPQGQWSAQDLEWAAKQASTLPPR